MTKNINYKQLIIKKGDIMKIKYIFAILLVLLILLIIAGCGCDDDKESTKDELDDKNDSIEGILASALKAGTGDLIYEGGDPSKKCAEQGNACTDNSICEGGVYVKSSDSNTCCQTFCLKRFIAKNIVLGDSKETVSLENMRDGGWVVWPGPQIDGLEEEVGSLEYIHATLVDTRVEFKHESKFYSCNIILNEDGTFVVSSNSCDENIKPR